MTARLSRGETAEVAWNGARRAKPGLGAGAGTGTTGPAGGIRRRGGRPGRLRHGRQGDHAVGAGRGIAGLDDLERAEPVLDRDRHRLPGEQTAAEVSNGFFDGEYFG